MDNLKDLERLLDVEYSDVVRGRNTESLFSGEIWHHANKRMDNSGMTQLMQAAKDGIWECADLLLRCGADVDARNREGRKAIEYSLDAHHPEMTLLLLQWDSLLPKGKEHSMRVKALIDQNDDIKKFFSDRDSFHKMLIDEKPESIELTLRTLLVDCDTSRRWVNSDGDSCLFTAAKQKKCKVWALLRASGFVYATRDEEEDAEVYETDDSFVTAVGKYFVEVPGCHVQKMVARSRMYKRKGVIEERCADKLDGYFKDIDEDEYTSELLQCLQDDPTLEIIFDFSSSDVFCMQPLGMKGNVWGLTDFAVNRIYVAAMETEKFDYSDVVSNLVHELAHKAMAVVFENGGLPYRVGDTQAREEYENIVKKVLSYDRKKNCDMIIQRVKGTDNMKAFELIVRVPEMISKHKKRDDGGGGESDGGICRLEAQAPELLEFYTKRVLTEIRGYVERSKTAGKVSKSELLRYPEFATAYFDEKIQVRGSLPEVQTSKHNRLPVLKVSNLRLAVSHSRLTLKDVIFVDWTKYCSMSNYFITKVRRNEIDTLAIVWDKEEKLPLCRSRTRCRDECIARELDAVVHAVILIVHKKRCVMQDEKCVDYSWDDLSGDTRNWVLGKEVCFGGRRMKCSDVLGNFTDPGAEDGSVVESLLGADELSTLIDEVAIHIGRPLESTLRERGFEILRRHPKSYISRKIRVRDMEFNKGVFQRRKNDVFFIRDARKSDLQSAGIGEVCLWNSKVMPGDARCFILSREWDRGDDVFGEIFERLKGSPPQEANGGKWHYVHFFVLENEECAHLYSFNCRLAFKTYANREMFEYSGVDLLECSHDCEPNEVLVIADVPGSGKSVFVNKMARDVKRKYEKWWVDVVELTLFESHFKGWSEGDLASSDKVTDFLYGLIKMVDTALERKIFDLFCQAKNKFFIFFDGFDEICPDYKEKFISFLEVLTRSTNVKVCLTTRVHEATDVEERLSTLAYKFIPFNREQQTKFLNLEWNASLKSLPLGDRTTKVESIISALQSPVKINNGKGIRELVENLKLLLEGDPTTISQDINFHDVAEELIEIGESAVGGKMDFSENPLHAWMLAYVVFEENFPLGDSLSLSQLYKRFVDMKIEIYSKEKIRSLNYVAGDAKEAGYRLSSYKLLKKFSAFFFLEDEDYELEEDEIHDMLRIGLVAQRENSVVFIHRTFGEYLFSLWLLDKRKKDSVTKVWLSKVLLENRFQKVRQFIDDLLLSEHENKSGPKGSGKKFKKSLLSQSAFPRGKELVESVQKCLFMSVLECHEGILQFLAESSGESLVDVIFGKADWNIGRLEFPVLHEGKDWNAFTFCGSYVKMKREYKEIRHSPLDYLKFLPKLLQLTEKHGVIANLEQVISKEGLMWMGFDEDQLWKMEIGKTQFESLFEFLQRNGNAIAETVREKMFRRASENMFINAAMFSFDAFVSFFESILGVANLTNLILGNENFLNAWTGVFLGCGVEDVGRMWRYLEGKLVTPEERKKILKRRDGRNRNAFFSACLNWEHPEVLPFVWQLCLWEMDRVECRDYLFASFTGVMDFNVFKTDRFLSCLTDIMGSGIIDGSEATRLLLVEDDMGIHYLLGFNGKYSPSMLYKFQPQLMSGRLDSRKILGSMTGHYFWLAASCFERHSKWLGADADFISTIEREFQQMVPSLLACPFADPIQVDGDGFLLGVFDEYKGRIEGFCLKTFLVVLKEQTKLEDCILGRDEFTRRLREDWLWIFKEFPQTRMAGDGGETRSFLIPYFFAVLLQCLSKEEASEILLHGHPFWGTVFHYALGMNDGSAFRKCYDVARWVMGEDALWRVHTARKDIVRLTVHESLLRKQDGGLFEESR